MRLTGITIILLFICHTTALSQIVSDWNNSDGIVHTWPETEEDSTVQDNWKTTLAEYTENEKEDFTEKNLSDANWLPEIINKTITIGNRSLDLPSMIMSDGTDLYMLFEEGINIYMSLNPPVFYEDIDYDTIRWIRFYAYSKKEYTRKIFKRYEGWKNYIEDCMRELEIPLEMGLLCLIESGCTTNAVSRAGAAGMWQFMPETAIDMGLQITPIDDERTNPYKATKAAAKYLRATYNQIENWTLSAAAYNCGVGKTQKIVKNQRTSNWADLKDYFPKETQQYIPALTAIYYVWNYRKELGLN